MSNKRPFRVYSDRKSYKTTITDQERALIDDFIDKGKHTVCKPTLANGVYKRTILEEYAPQLSRMRDNKSSDN